MERNIFTARRLIVAALIALGLAGIIAVAMYVTSRPSDQDVTAAKTTQLTAVRDTRSKVVPAVNAYLAAFKGAYNESKSAGSAETAVTKERDAFDKAVRDASAAIAALDDNRVANDGDIGPAVEQLKSDYDSELAFYSGLVNDYAAYTTLFAEGDGGCSGIFVGQADGLADRKTKLDGAATKCFAALDKLKASKNVAYADYAKKIERRVKNLQRHAATTVKAEASLKQFETRATDYQKQYADATARNAPAEEIQKLADELKRFNAEIDDNKANFDYAAKEYLSTVKEIPELFSAVYGTDVPARQKLNDQLIDLRTDVLERLLNGRTTA